MPPYRPRLPEIVAMLDAMPADIKTLAQVAGHSIEWTHRTLSHMVYERIIQRRDGIYSQIAKVEKTYGMRCCEVLQAGPMTASQLVTAGSFPAACAHSTLALLEFKGRVEVDSSVRPFRYRLPMTRNR